MSTMKTLSDAFAELERRADVATSTMPTDDLVRVATRRRMHAPLVAASVAVALAIAGGSAWLASSSSPSHTSQQKAADSPAVSSSTAAAFTIPSSADELAARFRAVLGDTATFSVTDTGTPVIVTVPPAPTDSASAVVSPNDGTANGAAIVGTLTADGVTGGFDLQIFRAQPADKAMCDDPDRAHCQVTTTADGSSLATGHEQLENTADGVTYEVYLIRADGVAFLMHVSNERDPKGASGVLAAHPPLTLTQMTAIVTSDRW